MRAVEAAPGRAGHLPGADLDKVLDALIENALRYGGGDITVVARPGGVEVLDRGPRPRRGRARRSSSASTAAARAGPGPPARGSGSRSRASWRAAGAHVELANRPGRSAARITVPRRRASASGLLNRPRATVAGMSRA